VADRVPVFCDAASVDTIVIRLVGVDFSWLMSYDTRLCKEVEKRESKERILPFNEPAGEVSNPTLTRIE
jgi:hypothetical protein